MPSLFARITKVDEEKRTVTGRAAQEVVDRDNEIFDYASSKPNFMKWSSEVHADSEGKSLGNVRAMHSQIAAGKLTDIQFIDGEQAIDVEAKIIDDNEWKKVLEGVYTGFSIGGRYTRKWTDTQNGKVVSRYTASPTELSLVDRPCIPTAKFYEVHKADGTTELRKFQNAEVSKFDMPTTATTGLQSYDLEGSKKNACRDESAPRKKVPREDVQDAKDDADYYGDDAEKRDFSQSERDKAADAGQALPDGSFPIKSVQDLKNAVQAYGRAKDKAKAKAHIISRAKALGATDQLPDNWKKSDEGDMNSKYGHHLGFSAGKAVSSRMQKGIEGVASLAALALQLKYLADGQFSERAIEGDDSDLPEKLRTKAAELLSLVGDMAKEEGEELANGDDTTNAGATPMMTSGLYRADVSEFAKALRESLGMEALNKEGRRNSAADLAKIQTIHDATCELGAECAGPHSHDGNPIENQETEMAVNKSDTISTEARARGATVSDASARAPAPQSSNADDHELTGSAGQEKRKARMARDEDEDEDEARKAKSRKDLDEDEDEDEDADEARKAKARKSRAHMGPAQKSKDDSDDNEDDSDDDDGVPMRGGKFDQAALAELVAKSVATAMAGVLAKMQKAPSEDTTVVIPRSTPNLFAVDKGGTVEKVASLDQHLNTLRKSVAPVPGDRNDHEDRGCASVIKAIRAKGGTPITQEQLAKLEAGMDAGL